jgi:3-hydroxyisobutyrate dehydrogenase-like beta-hydroxyacid dehydrogenase
MKLRKVGLLSPGDMGHTVGRVLIEHGMPVLTCLEGRSERTRMLAQEAGIEEIPTYGQLVRNTDMILSILVPANAESVAMTVAGALKATGRQVVYVDCNAIAPMTVRKLAEIIKGAGSSFVDVGIVGPPPTEEGMTRFYASGADADKFKQLSDYGLDVRVISTDIGQASGLKMLYGALTKGSYALETALLVGAWRMRLYEELVKEFQSSQAERYASMERVLQTVPYRARRWIGEMQEVAKTFEDLKLTPKFHQGAEDVYRLIGKTSLADETPETRDKSRTLPQLIKILEEM